MATAPRLRDSGNQLLDLLPDDEFQLLAPSLQKVSLVLGQVVHQKDVEVAHVYFPTTSLVSLLMVLEEADPVEATTAGKEGFVGLTVPLGIATSPHRVVCQMAGDGLRMPARSFLAAMERSRELTSLIHRYIAFSLFGTGQEIACNSLHSIEARASRWLLMLHDQVGRDEIPMTQEFLAYMLGVRRQSVTVVAGTLQAAGLISYRRGVIVVRDRVGLEEAACECYATLRKYFGLVVLGRPTP